MIRPVQVQAPEGSGERRFAQIGEDDARLKALGQHSESGKIENVAEVAVERSLVGERIVIVKPVGEIGADTAGIRVRGEKLKIAGEALDRRAQKGLRSARCQYRN